jgi:multidrug efflux pump subunit AcrB
MWLVRLALRRPYTVVVLCIVIVVMGALAFSGMTVDIFPAIDIPVAIAIWNYPGLSAEEMERRVVIISERGYSTTVNGIERIESQSIDGIGIIKVYFQPDVTIAAAIAQINAISNTILRIAPPGIQPPVLVQYNAANVPVAQVTMGGEGWSEQQLFDYGLNFMRPRLFTIPGLSVPGPYGGRLATVSVDIDPDKLAGYNASPNDVVQALLTSNLIIPGGSAKMGNTEYTVRLNSSPDTTDEFNALPIKVVNGAPVRIGDVAFVRFGFAPQTNIVRVNGQRSTFLVMLKHPAASTIKVVQSVKDKIPEIQQAAPPGLDLKVAADQSVFVRDAVSNVAHEAIIATILVSLMILVFLGSWRSTFVVTTSIPLSILVGVVGLYLTSQSINIMTLGGFALAIGMLVDDATVEVENIHRNLAMGKPLTLAVLDSASQIAVPAIVATLSICIVFFPVFLLSGTAKHLFRPLALAVVFSMLASYFLSRTLVPMMSRALLGPEAEAHTALHRRAPGPWQGFNQARERGIERIRDGYFWVLQRVMARRAFVLLCAAAIIGMSSLLLRYVGQDFFPTVDAGLIKLHVRAPAGTRLEETERRIAEVEATIRAVIPPRDLETVSANIGLPIFFNLAFVQSDNIGPADADILIALRRDHAPTRDYIRRLRQVLPRAHPGNLFYFQAADIVSQVLNFGLAAPLDVQVEGNNFAVTFPIAQRLQALMASVPGAADVHIHQVMDTPTLQVNVDRLKAAQVGLSQRDVATATLTSLSSSALIAPNYWLNPKNGVNYIVAVQTLQRNIPNLDALMRSPVAPSPTGAVRFGLPGRSNILTSANGRATSSRLADVARVERTVKPAIINHYTVQRVLDVLANVDGRDLGGVSADIEKKIASLTLPPGVKIRVRGQSEAMKESFRGMGVGVILAVFLVYLLMVVNFQSWLDPFIIMMAVPGALAGILWMLVLTGSTLNVSSLMGSIMAVGVAVANSILVVNFANDARREGLGAFEAALEAGRVRFRPVLMTALAMILGMLPMALALGEGGEQNAPLGRAVIGGLIAATLTTLFVVPVVYSLLRRKPPVSHELDRRFERELAGRLQPDTL